MLECMSTDKTQKMINEKPRYVIEDKRFINKRCHIIYFYFDKKTTDRNYPPLFMKIDVSIIILCSLYLIVCRLN